MKYRTYASYKDSGFPWLGAIPEHWGVKRLKHVAVVRLSNVDKHTVEGQQSVRLCNYVDVYKNELITPALDFMQASAADEQVERFTLRVGDVLITKDSESPDDIGVPALVSDDLGGVVCGYHLALVRPTPKHADGSFLFRFLQSPFAKAQFSSSATGITRFGLGKYDISNAVLPVPSTQEQRCIAKFLDRELRTVNALVAKQESLIRLLFEKRRSIIAHTITKGLRPGVRTRHTGVQSLGDIPSHWDVKRLWHLTPDDRQIMYGIVLPGLNVEDGVPIVKGGDVSPQRLKLESLNRTTPEIEAGYVRSRLKGGDLVYAIRGSIGMVEIVPDELSGANLTQDAARVSPRAGVNNKWLLLALKAHPVFAQLDAKAVGASVRGINIRDLKRAIIPVPPKEEQDAIAAYLSQQTIKIDALVEKAKQAIELLKEHRVALISAAVTGKIDVRKETS